MRGAVWISLLLLGVGVVSAQEACTSLQEGDVRLEDLGRTSAGRVEICHNEQWGTICGQSATEPWSLKNAQVACRKLSATIVGGGGALNAILQNTIPSSAQAPDGTPIHYQGVSCNGTETDLRDCMLTEGGDGCDHSRDVAIVCRRSDMDGDIRLVGDVENGKGAVEIYDLGSWTSVCPDQSFWNDTWANLACIQLGFESGTAQTFSVPVSVIGERTVYRFMCNSQDFTLQDCERRADIISDCTAATGMYGGVTCTSSEAMAGTVRLFGAFNSTTQGRVEVLYNGRWGTVCGTSWSTNDGEVACRQLNLGDDRVDVNPDGDYSGVSNVKPIWLSGLECFSDEDSLADCSRSLDPPIGFATFCSDHSNDAELDCDSSALPLSVNLLLMMTIVLAVVIHT